MIKELQLISNERILLSPLNWGLGHVTRTIPIIEQFITQNNEVFIACSATQKRIYKDYFTNIEFIDFPEYPLKFKVNGNWTTDILFQLPSLLKFISHEKDLVAQLIVKYDISLIISDQRFGFYSEKIKSVCISHQTNLLVPKWNVFAPYWNAKLLYKFNELWIPDFKDNSLAGNLSQSNHPNHIYIGPISRFSGFQCQEQNTIKREYLAIITGPYPYDKLFFEQVVTFLSKQDKKSTIICSKNFIQKTEIPNHICVIEKPNESTFIKLLQTSKTIISRSGYSTLMDLYFTGHSAVFIPTPGQFEQKYLAEFHKNHATWKFLNKLS